MVSLSHIHWTSNKLAQVILQTIHTQKSCKNIYVDPTEALDISSCHTAYPCDRCEICFVPTPLGAILIWADLILPGVEWWSSLWLQIFWHKIDTRALFQYLIRHFIVRYHEALKLRDWQIKLSHCYEILQPHWHWCCRDACQIWDFARSYNKTSYRILKQGPGRQQAAFQHPIAYTMFHNRLML